MCVYIKKYQTKGLRSLRMKRNEIIVLPDGKKLLNTAVLNREFRAQKNSLFTYLGSLAWFAAIFAFSYYLNPACFLCLIPLPFMLIKEVKKDRRRRKLKYYVITRPCIDKRLAEYDDSPDEWQLWFLNAKGDWNVAATVEKEFYDASEIGETFHLVFAEDEKLPCLWYRASEWTLDTDKAKGVGQI